MANLAGDAAPLLVLEAVPPRVVLVKESSKTVNRRRGNSWYWIFAGGITVGALLGGYAIKDSPPVLDATSSLSSIFAEFDIPFVESSRLWLASTVEPFSVGLDAVAKGQVRQLAIFATESDTLEKGEEGLRSYYPWHYILRIGVVGNQSGVSVGSLGRRLDFYAALNDFRQEILDRIVTPRPRYGSRSTGNGQGAGCRGTQRCERVHPWILQVLTIQFPLRNLTALRVAGIWAKVIENLSVIGYDHADLHLASYE